MADASHRLDADRTVAGRYRLRRLIARGGMAEVWEAEDAVLGRAVAVKMLLPRLAADPAFLERFRREAIAAARLAHPNVVATYDTGVDGGLAYIVMELVAGRTLRAALAERGALSPADATHVAAQVADALHYAHQAGIVHRDVKPANILLCPDGRVKVADFGIAKAARGEAATGEGEDLTGPGAIVGTAKYLSPEQVDGRPVDGRSDVYGLGVVLYEMLCGRPPFTGDTEMAVGIQHLARKPLGPRQVRAGIPRPLEAVVLQAMAKAPADRFPTAAAMQGALMSVDMRPDDAPPMVVRDETPPQGVPVTPPTFAQSEKRWLLPAVGIVVVAVTLGVLGVLFARSDTGQRLLNPPARDRPPATDAGGLRLRAPASFDPAGDGREHDEELALLVDGDRSTAWSTSQYASPRFGNLKPGVGIVLELDRSHDLGQLRVESSSRGWAAEVAVASGAPPTREAWGPAVASRAAIDGDATFELGGRSGSALLLWITHLGPGNASVSIGEVRVTAA